MRNEGQLQYNYTFNSIPVRLSFTQYLCYVALATNWSSHSIYDYSCHCRLGVKCGCADLGMFTCKIWISMQIKICSLPVGQKIFTTSYF